MSSNQKKSMITVCVLVVLIGITGTFGMGRIVNNHSDTAFADLPQSSSSLSMAHAQSKSIGTYIIEGAGYYLKAYSYSLLMANSFEMSDLNGINFVELQGYVNQAIAQMELAKNTYVLLVNKANNTPYNSTWINHLMTFDYTAFKQERSLNATVFDTVQYYLSNGDVRGVYAEMLNNFEGILADLYAIKSVVDGYNLPANYSVWRLNQQWSETMLFGQYVAEVFYQIAEE